MRVKNYLKTILDDQDRKPLIKIFLEVIHCGFIEKDIPIHYFTNLLYKKNIEDYKNYIGFRKGKNIIKNFYYHDGKNPELEDKREFYKIASKNRINTPRVIAESSEMSIIIDDISLEIREIKDFYNTIKELLKKSRTNMIFVKPIDGLGGKNSFKIESENDKSIEEIFNLLKSEKFIFQEIVIQDEKVNKIYRHSINTIRVHTFRNKNDIQITSALMRFGHNKMIVDNCSLGAFFIPVDLNFWTLTGEGKSYLNQGAETFKKHPDSDIVLDNFILPYQKEVIELVTYAAKNFNTKFIGWDVALTPDGPIIIEGNNGPHIFMLQMACGGIKSHPQYKKIFSDFL